MSIKILVAFGAIALLILSVLIYLIGVLLKKAWMTVLLIAGKKIRDK